MIATPKSKKRFISRVKALDDFEDLEGSQCDLKTISNAGNLPFPASIAAATPAIISAGSTTTTPVDSATTLIKTATSSATRPAAFAAYDKTTAVHVNTATDSSAAAVRSATASSAVRVNTATNFSVAASPYNSISAAAAKAASIAVTKTAATYGATAARCLNPAAVSVTTAAAQPAATVLAAVTADSAADAAAATSVATTRPSSSSSATVTSATKASGSLTRANVTSASGYAKASAITVRTAAAAVADKSSAAAVIPDPAVRVSSSTAAAAAAAVAATFTAAVDDVVSSASSANYNISIAAAAAAAVSATSAAVAAASAIASVAAGGADGSTLTLTDDRPKITPWSSPQLLRSRTEKSRAFWRTRDQSSQSSVSNSSICFDDQVGDSQLSLYGESTGALPPPPPSPLAAPLHRSTSSTPTRLSGSFQRNIDQFWNTPSSALQLSSTSSRSGADALPFRSYYHTPPSYDSASLPPFRGGSHRIMTATPSSDRGRIIRGISRHFAPVETDGAYGRGRRGGLTRSPTPPPPDRLQDAVDRLTETLSLSASPKPVRAVTTTPSWVTSPTPVRSSAWVTSPPAVRSRWGNNRQGRTSSAEGAGMATNASQPARSRSGGEDMSQRRFGSSRFETEMGRAYTSPIHSATSFQPSSSASASAASLQQQNQRPNHQITEHHTIRQVNMQERELMQQKQHQQQLQHQQQPHYQQQYQPQQQYQQLQVQNQQQDPHYLQERQLIQQNNQVQTGQSYSQPQQEKNQQTLQEIRQSLQDQQKSGILTIFKSTQNPLLAKSGEAGPHQLVCTKSSLASFPLPGDVSSRSAGAVVGVALNRAIDSQPQLMNSATTMIASHVPNHTSGPVASSFISPSTTSSQFSFSDVSSVPAVPATHPQNSERIMECNTSPLTQRKLFPLKARSQTADISWMRQRLRPPSPAPMPVSSNTSLRGSVRTKPPLWTGNVSADQSPLILRRQQAITSPTTSRPSSLHDDETPGHGGGEAGAATQELCHSMKTFQNISELSDKISKLPASSNAAAQNMSDWRTERKLKWFSGEADDEERGAGSNSTESGRSRSAAASWTRHPLIVNRASSLDKLHTIVSNRNVSLIYFTKTTTASQTPNDTPAVSSQQNAIDPITSIIDSTSYPHSSVHVTSLKNPASVAQLSQCSSIPGSILSENNHSADVNMNNAAYPQSSVFSSKPFGLHGTSLRRTLPSVYSAQTASALIITSSQSANIPSARTVLPMGYHLPRTTMSKKTVSDDSLSKSSSPSQIAGDIVFSQPCSISSASCDPSNELLFLTSQFSLPSTSSPYFSASSIASSMPVSGISYQASADQPSSVHPVISPLLVPLRSTKSAFAVGGARPTPIVTRPMSMIITSCSPTGGMSRPVTVQTGLGIMPRLPTSKRISHSFVSASTPEMMQMMVQSGASQPNASSSSYDSISATAATALMIPVTTSFQDNCVSNAIQSISATGVMLAGNETATHLRPTFPSPGLARRSVLTMDGCCIPAPATRTQLRTPESIRRAETATNIPRETLEQTFKDLSQNSQQNVDVYMKSTAGTPESIRRVQARPVIPQNTLEHVQKVESQPKVQPESPRNTRRVNVKPEISSNTPETTHQVHSKPGIFPSTPDSVRRSDSSTVRLKTPEIYRREGVSQAIISKNLNSSFTPPSSSKGFSIPFYFAPNQASVNPESIQTSQTSNLGDLKPARYRSTSSLLSSNENLHDPAKDKLTSVIGIRSASSSPSSVMRSTALEKAFRSPQERERKFACPTSWLPNPGRTDAETIKITGMTGSPELREHRIITSPKGGASPVTSRKNDKVSSPSCGVVPAPVSVLVSMASQLTTKLSKPSNDLVSSPSCASEGITAVKTSGSLPHNIRIASSGRLPETIVSSRLVDGGAVSSPKFQILAADRKLNAASSLTDAITYNTAPSSREKPAQITTSSRTATTVRRLSQGSAPTTTAVITLNRHSDAAPIRNVSNSADDVANQTTAHSLNNEPASTDVVDAATDITLGPSTSSPRGSSEGITAVARDGVPDIVRKTIELLSVVANTSTVRDEQFATASTTEAPVVRIASSCPDLGRVKDSGHAGQAVARSQDKKRTASLDIVNESAESSFKDADESVRTSRLNLVIAAVSESEKPLLMTEASLKKLQSPEEGKHLDRGQLGENHVSGVIENSTVAMNTQDDITNPSDYRLERRCNSPTLVQSDDDAFQSCSSDHRNTACLSNIPIPQPGEIHFQPKTSSYHASHPISSLSGFLRPESAATPNSPDPSLSLAHANAEFTTVEAEDRANGVNGELENIAKKSEKKSDENEAVEVRRQRLMREDSFNRPDSPMFHQQLDLPKDSVIRRHRRRLDRQLLKQQQQLLQATGQLQQQLNRQQQQLMSKQQQQLKELQLRVDSFSDSSSSSSCNETSFSSVPKRSPLMMRRCGGIREGTTGSVESANRVEAAASAGPTDELSATRSRRRPRTDQV